MDQENPLSVGGGRETGVERLSARRGRDGDQVLAAGIPRKSAAHGGCLGKGAEPKMKVAER